eukprot:NODE_1170_length_481_cov_6.268362_g1160_i0.p3 GENE.NODE_1170_length_481_cov_6.268362_g1160_i0~~NODE_1170_length_481_cov_6.268362_g1160_i0.p3  ORF type:complete len:59 (+),score=5.57 NODE_1170_length_481_cov_6.268362_g1160_i0:255-431(+)
MPVLQNCRSSVPTRLQATFVLLKTTTELKYTNSSFLVTLTNLRIECSYEANKYTEIPK